MEVRPIHPTADNWYVHRPHPPPPCPSKHPAPVFQPGRRLLRFPEVTEGINVSYDDWLACLLSLKAIAFSHGLAQLRLEKEPCMRSLCYKLSLRFPMEYPFKAPVVKFESICFHPNVDQFGNICLDILQDKWSSAYDCRTILLSIQSLLGEPNPVLSTAMLQNCGTIKKVR